MPRHAEHYDSQYGGAPPAQRHSETSAAASDALKEPMRLRHQVWRYLCACGTRGATDEEMQNGIPMKDNTQRPRRIELCQENPPRCFDSGRKRKTSSGRSATVWLAVTSGQQEMF